MTRKTTISRILDDNPDALYVASTGHISRELYELRLERKELPHDFYMMGSMGCAVGIGLGVALNTDKHVIVLTGDGALMMQLGSLGLVAKYDLPNLEIHVLDNGVHESTGGQPTTYRYLSFIGVQYQTHTVDKGHDKDMARIDIPPEEIVTNFMSCLS